MADVAARLPRGASAPGQHGRAQLIAFAGALIMLISGAAALLPRGGTIPRAAVIGWMMVTAGVVEVVAGVLRSRNRSVAMLPGGLTLVAGVLLVLQPLYPFVHSVRLVIGWLAARGLVLAASIPLTRGTVRAWTMVAAAMDLTLGTVLFVGLSASTMTLTFFGITPEVVGSFSWVVALSFVATGMLLMEFAACERAHV